MAYKLTNYRRIDFWCVYSLLFKMTIEYRFWFFAKSFFQSSLNACHASVPIATASNTIGISFSMSLLLKNNGEEWAMGIMAASRIRLFNKATVRNAKRQENWRGRITPFSDIKYRRRKFIEIIAQRTLKKRKRFQKSKLNTLCNQLWQREKNKWSEIIKKANSNLSNDYPYCCYFDCCYFYWFS